MAEEFNPFEDADEAPEEPTPAPKKPATRKRSTTPPTAIKETSVSEPTVESATNDITLTFKGGTGFDAPWVVVRAANLQAADDLLADENRDVLKSVLERTWQAASYFSGKAPEKPAAASNGGGSGATAGNTRRAPQGAQEAPGGESRPCKHTGTTDERGMIYGDMVYKTGVTQSGKNAGKTWRAFMCPAPKGADQCPPEWLK